MTYNILVQANTATGYRCREIASRIQPGSSSDVSVETNIVTVDLPGAHQVEGSTAENGENSGFLACNGKFQERWPVASGKNRVSGESGKAMKP